MAASQNAMIHTSLSDMIHTIDPYLTTTICIYTGPHLVYLHNMSGSNVSYPTHSKQRPDHPKRTSYAIRRLQKFPGLSAYEKITWLGPNTGGYRDTPISWTWGIFRCSHFSRHNHRLSTWHSSPSNAVVWIIRMFGPGGIWVKLFSQ